MGWWKWGEGGVNCGAVDWSKTVVRTTSNTQAIIDLGTIMNQAQEILQSMAERFATTANVKQVFGEPIERGGRTVIVPVARVQYRLGAGYGGGEQDGHARTSAGCGRRWWRRHRESDTGRGAGDYGGGRALHTVLSIPAGIWLRRLAWAVGRDAVFCGV